MATAEQGESIHTVLQTQTIPPPLQGRPDVSPKTPPQPVDKEKHARKMSSRASTSKVNLRPNLADHFPSILSKNDEAAARATQDSTVKGQQESTAELEYSKLNKSGSTSSAARLDSASDTLKQQYLSIIRQRIENFKKYPHRAQLQGLEGDVEVQFVLNRNGNISQLVLKNESGSSLLNDAAFTAVRDAAPFPPIPEGLFNQEALLELKIVFSLH